jgi:hypothetical protein
MKRKALGIILGLAGLAALALGIGHTAAELFGSFHSVGGSNAIVWSMSVPDKWLAAAVIGAMLCVCGLRLLRRRV